MMKPEKVKSRWRRSSEMEISERAALCPPEVVVKEDVQDIKEEEVLPSIKESSSGILNEENSIPEYVELEENMYLFERKRTKRKKEVRRMLCECSLSKEEQEKGVLGCQDECLNRLLMIECGSRCLTGESCSNRRFQKRLYAKVLPFKTTKKGWGLKLLEDVPMGNFVIEYCGEILSRQDFKQRVKQYAREKSNHYYFMSLKTDEIIDATNKGNLSRFMNHSCEPNCETQKWTVNGELRIGFFAKRDLKAGEELTFDYQFQRYGREAQKCYCFTDSCSGYIGVSNEIPVDVSKKAVNKRKKGGSDEKKREDLEDLILEEEIQKLYESGGLRNKEETLILARLMVRAEDTHSREKLLEILLGTSDVGFLRLFLEYHGLSLLWSWMVDLTDLKLKTKILQVLSLLPVSSKTILLESKVYNVVERWSSIVLAENHEPLQLSIDKNLINVEKKMKSSDTSDSENDGSVSQASENIFVTSGQYQNKKNNDVLSSENLSRYLEEGSANSTITSDAEDNSVANGKEHLDVPSRSDEEGGDIVDAQNNSNHAELMNLAHNLLISWENLKEDFKIPRQRQPNQRFQVYSRYNQRRKNDICTECLQQGSTICSHKIEVMTNRNRFSKDRNKDSFSHQEKVWGYRNASHLDEKSPRKVLLPTPVVLTKEERRLQFAREVLESDQRKALLKQQQYVDVTNLNGPTENIFYDTNTNYCYLSSDGNYYTANSEGYALTSTETNVLPYNQCYYDLNELQISQSALLQTPETTTSLNASTLPNIEINGSSAYQSNVIYQSSHQQLLLHGAQTSPISLHSSNVASHQVNHMPTSSNLIALGNITSPSVLSTVKETTPAHAAGLYTPIPNSGCVSSHVSVISPNSQYVSGQDHYTNNQNVIYYAQSQYTLSEQVSAPPAYSYTDANGGVVENSITIKLPPNWKTATDADGNIYYYHILTRQTQWDPPMFEEAVVDADGDTPTYDEPKDHKQYEIHSHRSHKKHPKKKSTTTAPADTSSNHVNNEVAKKIKELFRTKMSSFVVQCLNPYHRDDCRIGKITSNDDFKHLARKLTHFVMAKELKHCKSVEDLECNENVKHKARDYIYKYMAKYGPVYKKEKYASPF